MEQDQRQPDSITTAGSLGRISLLIRQAESADLEHVEDLPAIASEIQETSARCAYGKGESESLLILARYHAMKDEYIDAVGIASRALLRFAGEGDTLGQAKALGTLGFVYGQLGRLDKALGQFLEGLKLCEGDGHEGCEAEAIRANLLNNLASIYGDLGRYDEALEVLEQVLKHCEKDGGAPLVVALSNISEAQLKKGNVLDALVCNQRALVEILTKNLGSMYLHLCRFSSGRIYERLGQHDKALASYFEALGEAKRMGNRFSTAKALVAIGALRQMRGDAGEATDILRQAQELSEEIGASELLGAIHVRLMELSEQAGDYKEAFLHLKRQMEFEKELEKSELERRLSNYTAELRIDQVRKDAEIDRLKNVELRQKSEEIERKALELEESFRNIKIISEIGQRITNSLDVDLVLSTICESVSELMDAGVFAVGLCDDAMGIVDYKILMENSKRLPLIQVSMEDGRSFASAVLRIGKEILIGDSSEIYTENAAMPICSGAGGPPRSLLCCPLKLADRITGVIAVQSFRADAYTERNLETLKALASYIAIALNNSRQSEELRAKARELELASRTDPLTGLYNRRHMLEKIDEERVRRQRSARPFSVVICDIDFFKKVNDVFGHDCGDSVLKALSGLLGRHIRKQDCLARWGGEEFLLLLPETNSAGATVLAEKLRRRVEEFEFVYAGIKIPITMTFGVAEFIQDFGVDACIVGADSALYKGKSNGRNCVVTF